MFANLIPPGPVPHTAVGGTLVLVCLALAPGATLDQTVAGGGLPPGDLRPKVVRHG